MSLLIGQKEPSPTPQTHVLVIGVGGYRHLPGGAAPKPQAEGAIGTLGQLTSPPRSALKFATWLLSKGNPARWRVPLGSVDLLVSPAPQDPEPGGPGVTYEAATIANIQTSYNLWKDRCQSHKDNIAVFFFSGHGVEKQEHYLLAEDFGTNPNNPWLGSFAFDSTRRAFHSCRADTQCFFVDACRKVTSNMLTRNLPDIPLDVASISDSVDCAFNLTLKAAAHNEAALGPKLQPSYFTQALVKALDGAAAVERGAGWVVETGQIAVHINKILRLSKESEGYRQRCISTVSDTREIIRVEGLPEVHLTIGCAPPEANKVAQLSCKSMRDGSQRQRAPQARPWTVTVQAGIYRVGARFKGGPYRKSVEMVSASPPTTDADGKLRC